MVATTRPIPPRGPRPAALQKGFVQQLSDFDAAILRCSIPIASGHKRLSFKPSNTPTRRLERSTPSGVYNPDPPGPVRSHKTATTKARHDQIRVNTLLSELTSVPGVTIWQAFMASCDYDREGGLRCVTPRANLLSPGPTPLHYIQGASRPAPLKDRLSIPSSVV